MASVPGSPPWGRYRTAFVSGGNRSDAAVAAPGATATTGSAGSEARAEPAVRRKRGGCRLSQLPLHRAGFGGGAMMPDAATLATQALMQLEQQLGRRPVGPVNDEAPAEPIGLGADFGSVARNSRYVILAPVLGSAGRDGAGPFRFNEFDAPRVRKGLLCGIDDLHHVTERSGCRQPGERRLDLGERAPQVGQHDELGEWRRRKSDRQAVSRSRIMNHGLGDLLDHVAGPGRPGQAGNANPLSAVDEDLGERKRHYQGAMHLVLLGQR